MGVAHRSAIGGFVAGSIGGAAGGGASGFAAGMLMTGGDIEQAWKMAGQGALYGGIAGGVIGGYRGYKSAMPGTNKWTGNDIKIKPGNKFNGKRIANINQRVGRDGKAIEIEFKDGSKMDINKSRVKEWTPQTHPKAPAGTLDKIKFDNYIPGSKGYKRMPTQTEINILGNY